MLCSTCGMPTGTVIHAASCGTNLSSLCPLPPHNLVQKNPVHRPVEKRASQSGAGRGFRPSIGRGLRDDIHPAPHRHLYIMHSSLNLLLEELQVSMSASQLPGVAVLHVPTTVHTDCVGVYQSIDPAAQYGIANRKRTSEWLQVLLSADVIFS